MIQRLVSALPPADSNVAHPFWRLPVASRREASVNTMSQKTVHLVIARLLTDEDLRLQFLGDPLATLTAIRDQGFELTSDEMDALIETDRELWAYAAGRIHPRLQRCSFRSGGGPACRPLE